MGGIPCRIATHLGLLLGDRILGEAIHDRFVDMPTTPPREVCLQSESLAT